MQLQAPLHTGRKSSYRLKRCLVQRRTDFDTNGSISGL